MIFTKRDDHWQFAVDVGGTFTDCISRDAHGNQQWAKVLSSSITKGSVDKVVDSVRLSDPARCGDGPDFWRGYRLELFGESGQSLLTGEVQTFDDENGIFRLKHPLDSSGSLERFSGPLQYQLRSDESAPLLVIRKLLGMGIHQPLPPISVRLGTTRGTNALLTRSGASTALITTRGFGDVLAIADQTRPELFKLAVEKPSCLYQQVVEIDERILANGSVRLAPDANAVERQLRTLRETGIESVAICFLHGYKYPVHELLVGELAHEMGFSEISLSSEVAPLIKIVPRGETTVLDAYLNPILRQYLLDLTKKLHPDSRLRLMTSAGGLVPSGRFGGKESILSGPAGGVVGFSHVARRSGFTKSIGFDMGGTSTDVARYDGEFERSYESIKAGVRIVSPMMSIETVAAGGGSICWFDGTRLRVGPASAGAEPGPACYGNGGPLTVTDLNVFLGRMVAERFPFELHRSAITHRLDSLCRQVNQASLTRYTDIQLAEGLLAVAVTNMSAAVRTVSVSRGMDPAEYVLVAYGGAASQHACRVADELGINAILSHPLAGILSAVGISRAVSSFNASASVEGFLHDRDIGRCLDRTFSQLRDQAIESLSGEGIALGEIEFHHRLDLRYEGTQTPITIQGATVDDFASRFEAQHQSAFGYTMQRPVEVRAARVEAIQKTSVEQIDLPLAVYDAPVHVPAGRTQTCVFQAQRVETPVFDRREIEPHHRITGPAIVFDDFSSFVLEPAFSAVKNDDGILTIRRDAKSASRTEVTGEDTSFRSNPVQLEIFNNHFTSIAKQMGEMLRRTAISVNVKERLDFSCAIFTSTGDLVVNAPHVPVHLGAMSETVRATIEENEEMGPGDVFVSNDPLRGGSHLPDITVVTPVFDISTRQIIFFVASRCHHAEIGGTTPGSMPPQATALAEEGVLISNFKLVDHHQERFDELRKILEGGPYPSRKPGENIADLMAQVAANQRGVVELGKLIEQYSLEVVVQYMEFIQQAAEAKTRQALSRLENLNTQFVDRLDCGARIAATITKKGDQLTIDFGGTDDVLSNNLNANRAITTAAILYCLRCLIDEDIPLNQGILRPVQLVLPYCLLNPPPTTSMHQAPAVSGGNVETSQRIVDVLLGGMGLAAASQGTMNNVLMGDGTFSYYETICGGTGAVPGHPGCDAVHSHMTNTRLTDPEILESAIPVVLNQFAIRPNSGGIGKYPGGNGVIREFEFLQPLQVSLITNRRVVGPYGMCGGRAGQAGKNTLVRANGSTVDIGYQCQLAVEPGDRLKIETPGGGAWGKADP